MTVQPPTGPPWVRPEILTRFRAKDPAVVWESLSSPEQAQVVDERLVEIRGPDSLIALAQWQAEQAAKEAP